MSDNVREISEHAARAIMRELEARYGNLHMLRAAYRLLVSAEAMLELSERDDTWQSLGDAAARVVEKAVKP
jgi:hypothetical protein